ncbi:MAG TPA: lysylphosphatidylglycerol synthase transmembrane domain-containing protein [Roseiflexaceae bacterium]|nr:lysylphosphatidylglycerol synthase transmembrane domain-containing protein [Roseiflexaceae bacterium]
MQARSKRSYWSYILGAIVVGFIIVLVFRNWIEVRDAVHLIQTVQPLWLVLALGAIACGFMCAGQVYGRVLATLGFRENFLWLTATALVTVLINHAIPAGSVAAYAFLVLSLRRRGIPPANVALVAALELLSWNGAVLLLFGYGVVYLIFSGAAVNPRTYYVSVSVVLVILTVLLLIVSRPHRTLHAWAQNLKHVVDRVFGVIWTDEQLLDVVDEVVANRRLILEQPLRMLLLVFLQLSMFGLHSVALLSILHGLGSSLAPQAVLASYGLALIASTFVVLPGGGGTVEAALTLALTTQGIEGPVALSSAVLFRLLSFWLLLPLGLMLYRVLTRRTPLEEDEEYAELDPARSEDIGAQG